MRFTHLPKPSKENPYAQLDYIFHEVAETKDSKSTKGNYYNALTYYKKFLQETFNYNENFKNIKMFYIDQHWDEYVLVHLKTYINDTNIKGSTSYLSSYSIVGIFSAVKIVVKEAIINGYTTFENLINVSMGSGARETNASTSYSQNEMEQIENALKEELKYVYKVYRRDGYKKFHIGIDPRGEGDASSLWKCVENYRWYFENVLNFTPIIGTPVNTKAHLKYFLNGSKFHKGIGGIQGMYRSWGVTPFINADLLMPLIIKLAIETGLNVDSIYSLKTDCFEEKNPISGVPVIKYYKRRSGGEKEMHIHTTFDNDLVELKEFRADQSKKIGNIIKIVLSLTMEIRKDAPINMQDKLFIGQSNSQKSLGTIIEFNSKNSSNWLRLLVKKYNLKDDYGNELKLTLLRFRPTRATSLVGKGVELHELQYEMGHKNIETTMQYIDKNQLNKKAQEETENVIKNIFLNKVWAEENDVEYVHGIQEKRKENVIYKGFLCDCKNPFNPPEEVKKLKDYSPKVACNRLNMCLFCENVMIFKSNLPQLWMYKKQIDVAMNTQNMELPNERFYYRTLDIIEALFDENQSEFSLEVLEEAKRIAENLDELVDPITYRA